VLANHGITLRGIHDDTMLESYILDAAGSRHDLDTLALKYLGQRTIHFEDIAGKGAKQLTFNQVPIEQAAPYAAEDAEVTLRLHQMLSEKLNQTPSLPRSIGSWRCRWYPCCRASNETAHWSAGTRLRPTARS
jgi:DNA polymerase-1